MKAKELLDANQLAAAVADLTQEVKQHPADVRLRTFLFEVLCFSGEFARAERQLDVIGHQDEQTGIGVEVYRQLMKAESARRSVFHEHHLPTFLTEPPTYVRQQLEVIAHLQAGNVREAKRLFETSCQATPTFACRVNGQESSVFRDVDDRTANVLEVFAHDAYLWIPFEQVVRITMNPPRYLRDLLWTPASVEVMGRSPVEVFLPVLYVGSQLHANEQIRLGRLSDWVELGEGLVGGVGQKMFLVGDDATALLEIRELELLPSVA